MVRMFAVSVVLACLAPALFAAEVEQYHYQTRGNGADATAYLYDDCSWGSVWLYASESMTTANRAGASWTGGSLQFSFYDWCNQQDRSGWADLTGMDFDGNGARGASLVFNGIGTEQRFIGCEQIACGCTADPIECQPGDRCRNSCTECNDVTCNYCWCGEDGQCFRDECRWETTEFPVSIDLTWTGDGYVTRGVSNYLAQGPWGFSRSHNVGSSASGTVSGSIVVDGREYLGFNSYGYGSTWSNTSGSVSITRFAR